MTDYRDRDDLAERRGRSLIGLVEPHLPLEVLPTGPADAWQLTGPALVSRQVGSLTALLSLRPLGGEADPLVLLRTLYEHAVTFAWLAADPGEDRHRRFLKSDAVSRLSMDDDARRVGVQLLDEHQRAGFERQAAELPKEMPDLLQRAEAADRHWVGRIPALEDSSSTRSYRGLYAVAYRRHSAIAHASLMGLNTVTVELPSGRRRVQLEQRDPEMHGPFGLGSVLLGFTLFISGATLGWPDPAPVEAAFG
ncbi:MAG TPA: DUF5677 domain-containing protein [Solirubrobacterales bacterium]|nr:DUF5677 domain-containing protein [Solirubrobacterales bacterium]